MTTSRIRSEQGQTLIEFLAFVPVIALTIVGTGWVLRETNRRTECARTVFEAVRTRLEGGSRASAWDSGVALREVDDGVEGRRKCGLHTETVFLPKLDRRRPGTSAAASPSRSFF
jgi:hypothetical protein